MGQKTNPNIFQLGKTKSWNTKFIEKKSQDFSKYSFKNVELNKFILKFFADNKLYVYNCKIFYSENVLNIFVSYLVNFEKIKHSKILKTKNIKKIGVIKKKIAPKKIFFLKKKRLFSNFLKKTIKSRNTFLRIKKYSNKINENYEKKISHFEKAWLLKKTKVKTFDSILKYNFFKKLSENISLFFIEKPKLILNFYQFNTFNKKNFSKKEIQFIKKNLNRLRKFNTNSYFKEGLQYILLSLKHNKSSNFLAEYLSKELQKHKKQHFFLNFIKKTFQVFNNNEFCIPKSIKIQVKGRFNGAPRSKKRVLQIGKPMSIIKLNSKIYYAQTTSFSSNGTFGIKVWISKIIKKTNIQQK